jgi:hypothetical protein
MGKKDIEKNIWSDQRKWCVGYPHQSSVDEFVYRTRYYLRNQARKTQKVRTCGKNVTRKTCEEGV